MSEKAKFVAKAIYMAEPAGVRTKHDVKTGMNLPCSWDAYPYQEIYVRRAEAAIRAIARMPKVIDEVHPMLADLSTENAS